MKNVKLRFAGIGIILITWAVSGALVLLLWNALLPNIFGFPVLNYLQATGLLVLVRILCGSIVVGRHRGPAEHMFHHNSGLREKLMNMSDEERRALLEKRFSSLREFHRDRGTRKVRYRGRHKEG